jgi:hypothetical protein
MGWDKLADMPEMGRDEDFDKLFESLKIVEREKASGHWSEYKAKRGKSGLRKARKICF